jgi:hypothetical protein
MSNTKKTDPGQRKEPGGLLSSPRNRAGWRGAMVVATEDGSNSGAAARSEPRKLSLLLKIVQHRTPVGIDFERVRARIDPAASLYLES